MIDFIKKSVTLAFAVVEVIMRRDIPTGYSSIVRTLVDGKASDDLYYDPEMRPVRCSSGYYGFHREYDADGQNSSLNLL